jgi:2-dehydropantoate 2-reductase
MHLAVLGPGAIGSTFALRFAKAGHTVTVIARGQRLADLAREDAIVTVDGERAPVSVAASLDVTVPYDLLLVSVLAHQVDAVLPAVSASAAKSVMFMFNTFEPLDRLKAAVTPERFSFGFPAIIAALTGGRLKTRVVPGTTVTDPEWARVFTEAGIRAVVETDMHSWLRTHAALIAPVMVLGNVTHARRAGVSWREATTFVRGLTEGLAVVRGLGNPITPKAVRMVERVPACVVASVFWAASRLELVQQLGAQGPQEPRALIDAMTAAAPGKTPTLLAMRP